MATFFAACKANRHTTELSPSDFSDTAAQNVVVSAVTHESLQKLTIFHVPMRSFHFKITISCTSVPAGRQNVHQAACQSSRDFQSVRN